jgi:hypothetical protein
MVFSASLFAASSPLPDQETAAAPQEAAPAAEAASLPMRFRANAINMSNVSGAGRRSAQIDLTIERWSTNEERAALFEALKEPGPRSLPDALFSQESVGTIRESQSLGETLRYSRWIATTDGQRIILALDRPMGFVEMARSARTRDYNVTLIQLDLNAEGQGEGLIMLGAEFTWDDAANQIVITNFASDPIRLTRVRLQ